MQVSQKLSSYLVLIISIFKLSQTLPASSTPRAQQKVCRHHFPLESETPHPVMLEERSGRQKRAAEQKMRIKVLYHESVDELPRQKRNIVKRIVVPDAVEYWEDILQVVNPVQSIRLNRKCEENQYFLSPGDTTQYCKNRCVETLCGEFKVPKDHLEGCYTCDQTGRNCKQEEDAGKGVFGVDFVLYVSALTTPQCLEAVGGEAETVAYAAHCQQEGKLDRPVAGHTNICPEAISTAERDIRSLGSTLKHELLHAFGFSSSLFAFFRDKQGRPLTARGDDGKPPINTQLQVRQWSDKIIKTVQRRWKVRKGTLEKTTHVMVTPRVVEEVRRHFNCPTLEGAELEDQGGDGTSFTHWEKRIFQNEAMTGTVHTAKPVYTRLTLALLEDSGWYIPDYSKAQELSWGKGAGCDFATKSCKELMEQAVISERSTPFCNSLMQNAEKTFCTEDRESVGSCNLVVFSQNIPDIYQNFDAVDGVDRRDIEKVGSSVTLADFCPYVQEFSWRGGGSGDEDEQRGTRCENRANAPDVDNNYAIESFGGGSKCFRQGGSWEQKSCTMIKQWTRYGSGCYNYQCKDGRLNIIVRDVTYSCLYNNQKIPIQLVKSSSSGDWLHTGSVICPACSELCSDCSREGRDLDDHYEKRENLGDCLLQAEDEDDNLLIGFLKEFGAGGFSLG